MANLSGWVTKLQSASSNTTTTGTITSASKDVVVVGIAIPGGGATVTNVADTAGNTYTNRSRTAGTGISAEVWTAANVVASITNQIIVTLNNPITGWEVVAGSYAGVGSFDAVGAPQNTTTATTAVSVSVSATNPGEVVIAHVFTTPPVTTSNLSPGYIDIPGSGTSYLVHQSYLQDGVSGVNTFGETISNSQNLIAVLIALGPAVTEWSAISGKPYVTVSPVGAANLLPMNNGADFGPDTPGTATSGIQEAINAVCNLTAGSAPAGGHVVLLPGTFVLSSSGQILLYQGLFLEGSSQQGTTIEYAQSSESCLLNGLAAGAAISGVRIANLRVTTKSTTPPPSNTAVAIDFSNINNSTLDKVQVDGYWGVGVFIGYTNGYGNTLLDVQIIAPNSSDIGMGLEINAEGTDGGGGNRVIGGRISGCLTAIYLYEASETNIIMVDLGYNNSSGAKAIDIENVSNYTNILGCWFEGLQGGTAINIASGCTDTMILNPFFNGEGTGVLIPLNDANYNPTTPTIPLWPQMDCRTPYRASSGLVKNIGWVSPPPTLIWDFGRVPRGTYRISGVIIIANCPSGQSVTITANRTSAYWGNQSTVIYFNGPSGCTSSPNATDEWSINTFTFTYDPGTTQSPNPDLTISATFSPNNNTNTVSLWAIIFLEQLTDALP
jgi:hypothetical protein